MIKDLEAFFQRHHISDRPLLLGYSGGVDSTALFYLLRTLGLNVHALHIDHRWRESSLEEALLLQRQTEALNVPFYLETITTIDPQLEGNLEEKYRMERRKIFKNVYDKIGAHALLLAHQKEDQAETIFKRIFEGASLSNLTGLKECSFIEGMKILRPMLSYSKKQLYELVEKEALFFIEDETNYQPKYLRARQRISIFPAIEKSFGKNAVDNLCRFGKTVHRYEEYMEKKMEKYQEKLVKGPLGVYLDLSLICHFEKLELEFFIRKICRQYQETISYEALEILLDKIEHNVSNKKIKLNSLEIIVDRGCIFFVKNFLEWSVEKEVSSEQFPCSFEINGLVWKIEEITSIDNPSSWKALWQGAVDFVASEGGFSFKPIDLSYRIKDKPLKEIYMENKIPAFLRKRVPNVFQKETLKHNQLIQLIHQGKEDKKTFRLSIISTKIP